MKKHFIKVKQFADNVGRTEKKEVLSKDLASVEKRVKLLEQTCSATYKKLVSLQGAPGTQDVEKRRRKQLTRPQMSAQFLENRSLLDDGGSVGGGGTLALMYRLCGDAYATLAEGATVAQTTLEDDVLVPLNNVVENDFPNVMKLKKQLEKMTAELDVLKQKWQTSVRQSAQVGSSGIAAHAAKVEQTKAEMDDLLLKTEQCKDFLATELYRLCSKEAEFGQLLIKLVEIQRQCHRDALTCLDELLPALHSQRDLFRLKPVYGVALDDHLRATDRDVAEVLEDCICSILDLGLEEEGLFRVAGSKTKIKKLTAEFDVGSPDLTEYDIHCITGALKQYLRALPEPLMTFDLYDDWMEATRVDDLDSKLQALWIVCSKLPKTYYTNLRYLVKFLAKLVTHSQTNKMTPTNVAIVFGPNLIYPKGDDGMNVFMSAQQSSIIETLVQHADWFFPGDEEFKVTADGVKVASPFMLSHLTSDDALSLASTDLRRRNQSHDLLNVTATPPSRHEAPDNISLTSSSRCASQDSLSSLLTPGESSKQEGRRRKRHAPPVPIETAVVVPMETVTEPNSFVDRENKTNGECVRPSSIEAEKSPILAKERPVPPQRSSSYTPPTNSNRRPSGPPPGKPPPPTAAARLHKPDVIPGNDAAVRGQRLPAEKVPPPVPTKPALDRRAFTPARSPSVEVAPKKHSVTSDPILSPSADTRKVESNAIPTRRSGKKFTDHRRNDDDEEVPVNNGGKPTEHIYAVLDANTSVRVPSPGGVDADATSNGKDCVPSVPPVFEPPGGRLANLQESASDRPALSPPPVPVQGNDNPRPVTREDEDDEHSTWF
ncbi:PREDICTED: rho GTPase-activating protein 44-like isoform X1 [Priapulus caudatus]|uniref:Rho GTPase-activating protein 44-like isoform X1 n=1 Tax=Priapulus caudatus TaxID=37621 RepID=A0ABM1DXC1_PRICU|nr:PREDICTED: rho GTPase-activating protein 44-like isoform X1 [Priapulus caudatus]